MTKAEHAGVRSKPSKINSRRRGSAKSGARALPKTPRLAPATPAKPVDAELNRDTPSLLAEEPGERITDAVEPGPVTRRRDEPVEWLERNSDTEGSVE